MRIRTDIKPGHKPFKKLYIKIMLFVVGRAIQASAKVDPVVKKEFAVLRDDFCLVMGVKPAGPYMVIGKVNGKVKYLGGNPEGKKPTLFMTFKNIENAILVFTFQEGTSIASCRNRIIVGGDIPDACGIVRVLDIVETLLLPKCIAKLAVKRYPKLGIFRKHIGRIRVYGRTLLGV